MMGHAAGALNEAAQRPADDAESFVRDLLWNQHPECCGCPVVGAEYMGSQEMICCGNPDPAELTDAQIVASLIERFPEANGTPEQTASQVDSRDYSALEEQLADGPVYKGTA